MAGPMEKGRDVVVWFRARRKKGYQTALNAARRAFSASQAEPRQGR
ncbi:hypothetical protein [Solidesulfovibrio carbinoliphilus]|nr:hypothetical protein [Solidesulfovibrio carbinoliphilus]